VRRRDSSQDTLLTGNLQRFPDRKDLPRIKASCQVPNDISCPEPERDSKSQGRSSQDEAGEDSDNVRIDLELGYSHHRADEEDDAGNQSAERRSKFYSRTLGGSGDSLACKLPNRTAQNQEQERYEDIR
jgi:hypothetical protein